MTGALHVCFNILYLFHTICKTVVRMQNVVRAFMVKSGPRDLQRSCIQNESYGKFTYTQENDA